MTNIVREFDTPLTVEQAVPTRPATNADGKVLVEDSVTHQAGEGMTAGLPESMETPDIFDNRPQAVVKPQTADQQLVDEAAIPVEPVATPQEKLTGENSTVIGLETLPDGSVDIPRQ